ncbi:thiamine-phosphate kinase [Coxiella-like endosymbiont of Rhipicephalus sanguineus]|uniref:thiamine-phosphate kinase n=1 Tax=Coxiella-like endosymbiont of Rhipicephalus sanguineus TaxID=1955402 RepID=UPI00203E5ED1|nr:thiamine-phosphate kinase [Coxiella-like endosymbiont of Rhipicephalus sanguineus]MBT8506318.1 thiamine-phosphate kinase [Coxiella-like endosymbiont of Rhipicephalus sanguineus]
MALSEFSIIDTYFRQSKSKCLIAGIGDDAAVIEIPPDTQIVTSIDTLVKDIHFSVNTLPRDLGYKALAVNLSDLAAMGAKPDTALLALTLEKANKKWLEDFSEGFFSLAEQYRVSLMGGDITAGPLCISIVVNGMVPQGKAIYRRGAKAGDLIYVTGTIGDAGLALDLLNQKHKKIDPFLLKRLHCPSPRIKAGLALRGIASAAIDISDGLVADLEKIIQASGVGAKIHADQLPLSENLKQYCALKKAWNYALTSGDDYELCFTVPHKKSSQLEKLFKNLDCEYRCIGEIIEGRTFSIVDDQNQQLKIVKKGYEHF